MARKTTINTDDAANAVTPRQQEAIDQIMDYFDFARVKKCMDALNWTWAMRGVPDEPSIRKSARERLRGACESFNIHKAECVASSGGLTARCSEHGVSLAFEVDEWAAEYK